jgi:predicted nicotinamide N-methyase
VDDLDLVPTSVFLPGGSIALLQPRDGADLPDRGDEWAPLVPYWSVLWRSGLALAREVSGAALAGRRVVELGCGLGLPSLVAARAGASVLATDESEEAVELLERNARANGVALETAAFGWADAGELVARGPFDLVLAADVLYEPESFGPLLDLLPRVGREFWIADPGRSPAEAFLAQAKRHWSLATQVGDGVSIHRLRVR